MKKTLKFAFCFLFITFTLQGVAQKSVTESTKAAQKLMKKVTKGQFNKLKTNYETALIEINDCEKKSKEKEFGNDALVERLPDWITLNKTLSQFPNAYVVFKADTIHFAIKDYTQTLVEAKASAAKAHFDAATKIINTETEYSKRASAFRHFKKVAIYSDKYNDQIKELSAKIHYEEGLKIYNSGTTFDEKLQAEFAFKKAKEFIQPYKNIDELMAKLYFDEAVKLSKSASTDDLSNASRFFTNTNNYVADYKGCLKLKSDTRNKAAEIVYQKALAEEKKMSFESQAEAAKLYNAVETWVKGYKNAGEKANQALARCEVNVFLIENDGSFIHPRSFENGLQNKTKKYILTPPAPESISNLDLNVTKNITVAKEKLGYGFVLIKVGNSAKDPKFTQTDGPVKTTITNYYSIDVNNGGAEKKINEKTYTDGVTSVKFLGKNPADYYRKYEGVLTTYTKKNKLSVEFPIEVWDVRDPSKPVLLGVYTTVSASESTVINETYSGSEKTKPATLRQTTTPLKSENELKAEIKAPSVKNIVKNNLETFVDILNAKISFK